MSPHKKNPKHLSFLVDKKILQTEEEDHYRMDLLAHEKTHIPWLKNYKKPKEKQKTVKAPRAPREFKAKFLNELKFSFRKLKHKISNLKLSAPKIPKLPKFTFPWKASLRFSGVALGLFMLLFTITNAPAYTKLIMANIADNQAAKDALIKKIELEPITNDPWSSEEIAVDSILEQGTLELSEKTNITDERGLLSFDLSPTTYDNRIIIPSINVNAPIVEPELGYESLVGENWNELEDQIRSSLLSGVVHYPGTAEPGKDGNVFLTAHSSNVFWEPSQYNTVFALVPRLEEGADIYINYNQEFYHYKVSFKEEVKPSHVEILAQDENKLTLVTCTPVGTTLNRTVVTAYEVFES